MNEPIGKLASDHLREIYPPEAPPDLFWFFMLIMLVVLLGVMVFFMWRHYHSAKHHALTVLNRLSIENANNEKISKRIVYDTVSCILNLYDITQLTIATENSLCKKKQHKNLEWAYFIKQSYLLRYTQGTPSQEAVADFIDRAKVIVGKYAND